MPEQEPKPELVFRIQAVEGPELVTNGTFDSDLSGWDNWGMTPWYWEEIGDHPQTAVASTGGEPT